MDCSQVFSFTTRIAFQGLDFGECNCAKGSRECWFCLKTRRDLPFSKHWMKESSLKLMICRRTSHLPRQLDRVSILESLLSGCRRLLQFRFRSFKANMRCFRVLYFSIFANKGCFFSPCIGDPGLRD